MKKTTLLLLSLLFACISNAQTKSDDLSIGLLFQSTSFQNDRLPSLKLEAHYYITNRWATGGNLVYSRQKYGHAFGLDARRTFLHYFSANWSNRLELLQTEKFSLNANLDTGVIVTTLRDREKYEWVNTGYYYDDGYYMESQSKVYDKLDRQTYFSVQPNIGMNYKIFDLSTTEKLSLHLTAHAGYQFAIGGDDFISSKDFEGFVGMLGFKIIGPTKE